MNIHGQFLVLFGERQPPQVHLLGELELEHFQQLRAIRVKHHGPQEGMALAAADMFGDGAEFACPTWGDGGLEAMTILAQAYNGPHMHETRRLCACILTGLPFNPEPTDSDGGTPAVLKPEPPQTPPGGAKASPPADDSSKPRTKRSKVNVRQTATTAA